jgi:hypothetical protein
VSNPIDDHDSGDEDDHHDHLGDDDPTLDRTPERSIIAYDSEGKLVHIEAMLIDGLDPDWPDPPSDESDAN